METSHSRGAKADCIILLMAFAFLSGCQASWMTARPTFVNLSSTSDKDKSLRIAWEAWGQQYLCDGDILFVLGESHVLFGLVNFSRFSAEIAQSEFSHVGVIAIEEGEPVVYDVTSEGALRRTFGAYMTEDCVWSVGVKRLRPSNRDCIPAVLDFCRHTYVSGNRFDEAFDLENDRYYCGEFVEAAFRSAGQPLTEPVRIKDLPGFDQLSQATVRVIELTTSVSREKQVIMPGNANYGLWSSAALETVIEKTDAKSPPPTEMTLHRRLGTQAE